MYITELHISDFKGIENIEFAPHERLNVFIGNNGSGKSSLLQSLSILLSWVVARVKSGNGKGQTIGLDDIRVGASGCNLSCKMDVCPEGWNIYRNAPGRNNAERQKTDLSKLMRYVRRLQEEMEANDAFNLPLILHYPVTRTVLDIPLRIRNRHQFNLLAAYDDALHETTATFRRFFEWYREREDLENEMFRQARRDNAGNFEEDAQLRTVRTALQAFFPQFTNWHIQRNPLAMVANKDGIWLKINQLSDGEKCFIALIADLARRFAIANPSLPNPLEGRGVVMIDEIDLHLHPSWQMMVIPQLLETFPNCQFFITTHSPMVVNHVRTESLFVLQAANEHGGQASLNNVQFSYGQTAETVYKASMGMRYTRPVEIEETWEHVYRCISENRLEEAKELIGELKTVLSGDPEILKAEGLIRRKELIGI